MTRYVIPRDPGEDVIAWMERNARENGWPTEPGAPREGEESEVRLPYKESRDPGEEG